MFKTRNAFLVFLVGAILGCGGGDNAKDGGNGDAIVGNPTGWVRISSGTFTMGSPEDELCRPDPDDIHSGKETQH
ncbi:MAG: hypothetical protein V1754_06190, partial [Pseudomonadota bacterium]